MSWLDALSGDWSDPFNYSGSEWDIPQSTIQWPSGGLLTQDYQSVPYQNSGGNWLTNLLGGVGGYLGNNWQKLLPLAMGGISALNKPKQSQVQTYTPPMTAIDQSTMTQLQNLANEGLNTPATWGNMLKQMQEANVARGFSPTFNSAVDPASGMLSKSIASQALNMNAQNQAFKANTLGQISNINRGYASQPMVIPPTTSPWERFFSAYMPLITAQNVAKAYNPNSTWSWGF